MWALVGLVGVPVMQKWKLKPLGAGADDSRGLKVDRPSPLVPKLADGAPNVSLLLNIYCPHPYHPNLNSVLLSRYLKNLRPISKSNSPA